MTLKPHQRRALRFVEDEAPEWVSAGHVGGKEWTFIMGGDDEDAKFRAKATNMSQSAGRVLSSLYGHGLLDRRWEDWGSVWVYRLSPAGRRALEAAS